MNNDALTLARPQVEAEAQEAKSAIEVVRAWPMAEAEARTKLNDVFGIVRTKIRGLEEQKALITDPIKKALKAANDMFDPVIEAYQNIEQVIRDKTAEHALAARNADREARAKALAAPGSAEAQTYLATVTARPAEVIAGLGVSFTWEYKLQDLDQVPREWLTLDHSKVKIHCRTYAKSKEIPPIAGLEFTQTATTRAKPV